MYAFRVGEPECRQVAVLFRDITERRTGEIALSAARADAERANRAKDAFVAKLAHELRAPLAPMLTAIQLMRLRGWTSREQDVLVRQVNHLARMVEDLLDISRINRGELVLHRQPTELSQVVLLAMELAGGRLDRHVVDVCVPTVGAGVNVDLGRMAQALSNLLTNAAKYSDATSRIGITGYRNGETVRISVTDSGIGVPADLRQRIFEPFVQQPEALERAAGGLGLGLAIVHDIVSAHGGTVRVETGRDNHGSEFIIELPAVAVSPEP